MDGIEISGVGIVVVIIGWIVTLLLGYLNWKKWEWGTEIGGDTNGK